MRAPVSVVIPTLDAGAALPATLAALMEGVREGLLRDLVISDGGSRDATLEIARAAGAVVLEGPAGRGGQLRRGCAAARGGWLLVLHADTRLSRGWSAAAREHIARAPERAGYFRRMVETGGRMAACVAAGANLRSRLFDLPYGDQGLLVSRALYDAVGGFAAIPLMEDVALARALRGRLSRLDAVAVTGAERYLRRGWLRQSGANMLRLSRFLAGADPARLAGRYDRRD